MQHCVKIVLLGGGHANCLVLRELVIDLQKLGITADITLISKEKISWYSGMLPGCIAKMYKVDEICINLELLCQYTNTKFIEEEGITIEPQKNQIILKNGVTIDYDYLLMNIGSQTKVNFDLEDSPSIIYTRPISQLITRLETLEENLIKGNHIPKIAIVGSGAAGIELCFGIKERWNKCTNLDVDISLISNKKDILSERGTQTMKKVEKALKEKGIRVILDANVDKIKSHKLSYTQGESKREIEFDFVVLATGASCSNLFRNSGIETDDLGFMLVDDYLQCPKYPNILGAGDCVSIIKHYKENFPPKAGVYAVREAPFMKNNLLSKLSKKYKLRAYDPQREALVLLNVCDGTAIASKYGFSFHNKWMFRIKNKLDTDFVNLFKREKLEKLK